MTNEIDSDQHAKTQGKTLPLGFASSDLESAGIRVTRAEFSRIMECSKQAVTDWVKSGRIVVGADGRFDPRKAVGSLLRTGDPAKIRARILVPLVREMEQLRSKGLRLEAELSRAREDASFHEGSAEEVIHILEALRFHLELSWPRLQCLPAHVVMAAVTKWVEQALVRGGDPGITIADLVVESTIDSEGMA